MNLIWLGRETPFPPVGLALQEPEGLLAAGADLSVPRLAQAYANGIFPWYSTGEPILWWSPDPRMVLACADFKVSRSLGKQLRRLGSSDADPDAAMQIRVDTAFERVLHACAQPRPGQINTWITREMQQAYLDWHHAGGAHSIETWMDGELVAGLYGVSLGAMFYGESMFTRIPDGSKLALAYLVRFLTAEGVPWIDCQQQTSHLASLGARPMPRSDFIHGISALTKRPAPRWRPGRLNAQGQIT